MATGMVLIIVMRHIDLSVGSIIGFVSTIIGVAQVYVLPKYLGLDNPSIWIIAVVLGAGDRRGDRRLSGLARRLSRHSRFHRHAWRAIVLARRGVVGDHGPDHRAARRPLRLDGRRTAWLDRGGGELGAVRRSCAWASCSASTPGDKGGRGSVSRNGRFGRNMLIAVVGCFIVIGATAVVNAYPWPERVAAKYAADHNIPVPEGGLFISTGYAIPVLMALVAGVAMTFLARRTRFGRYVYAIGGNPEAAELAGINTKQDHRPGLRADGRAGGDRRRASNSARLELGDQRARAVRRTLCHRRRGDRRHLARRRRRHDLRRADRRAWSSSRCSRAWCCSASTRLFSKWWSASCSSARSASTPSTAAEPPRGEPWKPTLKPRSSR